MSWVVAASLVAAVVSVPRLCPVLWVELTPEDGAVENLTLLLFAAAAGLSAWLVVRRPPARRWWVVLFALGCGFVAGEEISWGQRWLGFAPATWLKSRNIQNEANLHNLVTTHSLHLALALVLGLAVLWSLSLPRWSGRLLPLRPSARTRPLLLATLLVTLGGLAPRGGLLHLPDHGEIVELFLGLLCLAVTLEAVELTGPAAPLGSRPARFRTRLLGALAVVAGGAWWLTAALDPPAQHLHAATSHFLCAGLSRQAGVIADHVDRHELPGRAQAVPLAALVAASEGAPGAGERLATAVERQRRLVAQRPASVAAALDLAYLLLARGESAEAELARVAELSRRGLAVAAGGGDERLARAQLAVALCLGGQPALAREELELAARVACDPGQRRHVELWLEVEGRKAALVGREACRRSTAPASHRW